jgi:hypothetical protein
MSRADEIRAERKERGSDVLNGTRMRLSVNNNLKDPAWEYRWVNQEGDRVFRLQEIGYEVVSDRNGEMKKGGMGSDVSVYAGTMKDGSALKQVLMRIPREIYHEDQASKKRAIDETEAGIASGKVAGASHDDQSKIYGGMTVTVET